jgi:nitrate reductase NapE component
MLERTDNSSLVSREAIPGIFFLFCIRLWPITRAVAYVIGERGEREGRVYVFFVLSVAFLGGEIPADCPPVRRTTQIKTKFSSRTKVITVALACSPLFSIALTFTFACFFFLL